MNRGSESRGVSRASASEGKRLFTPAEANRALPLVERIVEDIMARHRALGDLHLLRQDQFTKSNRAAVRELDRRASSEVGRIHALIAELKVIGCILQDWETGKVDFPAKRAGREVYLCWKPGEARVAHWHEVYAGVADRRPIRGRGRRVRSQRTTV